MVAGDQPDLPVEAFSQRIAYTSERAPNSEASSASFDSFDELRSTPVSDRISQAALA